MASPVSIERVTKRYAMDHSFVTALDDASFSIDRGEFLAIAGPSGSAKSTLLNLIGCIDSPSRGRIVLEGVDTSRLRPVAAAALRREKIGFVFQSFNLIPVSTAAENVEYPLLLHRMPESEKRSRVAEALESVGLTNRARHRPDLLSGGERQRVAVARAIVHRPVLVLADEPTANLDTQTARQLMDLMRELNHRLGLTFLFSTHDQRLLDRADWIVRLCDGSVVEDTKEREVAMRKFLPRRWRHNAAGADDHLRSDPQNLAQRPRVFELRSTRTAGQALSPGTSGPVLKRTSCALRGF